MKNNNGWPQIGLQANWDGIMAVLSITYYSRKAVLYRVTKRKQKHNKLLDTFLIPFWPFSIRTGSRYKISEFRHPYFGGIFTQNTTPDIQNSTALVTTKTYIGVIRLLAKFYKNPANNIKNQ